MLTYVNYILKKLLKDKKRKYDKSFFMAKIYKNLEIMAHNFKLMKHYLLILKGQLTFFGKYF